MHDQTIQKPKLMEIRYSLERMNERTTKTFEDSYGSLPYSCLKLFF